MIGKVPSLSNSSTISAIVDVSCEEPAVGVIEWKGVLMREVPSFIPAGNGALVDINVNASCEGPSTGMIGGKELSCLVPVREVVASGSRSWTTLMHHVKSQLWV